jgi:hypothetical protein
MPRDVVAVRVRHERERLPALRVEPQIVSRQMQAALMKNRDQAPHCRRSPRVVRVRSVK